jgi:DNA mismatch repair protein MutS
MPPPTDQLTPLFKQFWDIKRQYPDVILMFRLGDFFEMFGEDAETAARVLEITLTSRDYVQGERIPMCGVPHHAVDRYVARLIAAGHRVALCDQVEDARYAKGLVKRKVTRVVTPGTVLEDSMLEAKANNYLAAVTASHAEHEAASFGLALCDVSTGEFAVTEIAGAEAARRLSDELDRLGPRELILPQRLVDAWEGWLSEGRPWTLTPLKEETFRRKSSRQSLLDHFGVLSLRGFGCEDMELAIEAAGAVLAYLGQRHIEAAQHLRSLTTYSASEFMSLDPTARRNLELTQTMWDGGRSRTLLSVLDTTCTAMGGRLLRKWLEQPLMDPVRINERLDAVEELADSALLRGDLRERLSQVSDLERLASRAATGAATPRDLAALRASLRKIPELRDLVAACSSVYLSELSERLEPLDELASRLEAALVDEPPISARDGGIIRPGYARQLDDLRTGSAEGKDWIANLEATERERTGIKSLKVGYNSVFGYYIEVTKPNVPLVPPDYHRKQTTANAERYITPELKEREVQILGAEEKIQEMEARLFNELREAVGRDAARILATAAAMAEVDVLAGYAETGVRNDYVRPGVDAGEVIQIFNGRHPVVERLGEEPFIPNDALLDNVENRLLIITGPNMAGKCVAGDTLVFTDRGLAPIVELMPPLAGTGVFTEMSCRVQGLDGESTATHFYVGGRQNTIKVITRLGFEIEGTSEHRVWARFPDGSEGWKRLGELVVEDVVAIERHANLWGSETRIARSAITGEALPARVRRYDLPDHLSPDLAYLMGLLVGDGSLTYTHAFVLSTADEFIADEFRRIVRQVFGYEAGCKSNGKDYFVTSCQLRRFLEELDLGYAQAHEKRVPGTILQAPREIVIAFLQGLFDTDGHANNRYGGVQLATASPELARQVQLLLLNLGIVSSRHCKQTARRPCYMVSAYGADAISFHRQVGFRLPRKRERAAFASEVRMPNIGGIPHLAGTLKAVQERIVATAGKPVALKHNKGINSIFYTYIPSQRNISYSKLDELLTYCSQNGVACPELQALQTRKYFYDRVSTLGTGNAEVFDLSVETDHAYVAGGFVSHNSTYLRQVALTVLMAQAGCFVPADGARIGVVDRIFTRVGAHDDLASGQSTFMVEMNETASILNNVTGRSLVILDEIGRGTSTYDGLSIAWAVAEHLQQVGAKTLFATHYHHLNDLAERLPGVKNYRAAVKEDGHHIVWLRKIVPGGTDRSYGIQVARLAGLPEPVIVRAREVLQDLEAGDSGVNGGLPAAATQISEKGQRVQLNLFEAAESPVLEELKKLDLGAMTPIEALTVLYQLQKRAAE